MMENMMNEHLYQVLLEACEEGARHTVELLLDVMGLNVDGIGENGEFVYEYGGLPLLSAVTGYAPNVVELLLQKGADPNMNSAGGVLPLVAACRLGNKEIAESLLHYGADIHARQECDKAAPIHWAVYGGNRGTVELLCERGAMLETLWLNPDDVSAEPRTPLMLVVTNFAHPWSRTIGGENLEILLGSGANINTANDLGKTALMYAAAANSAEAVKLLLGYGADAMLQDTIGQTALDKAWDEHVCMLLSSAMYYRLHGDRRQDILNLTG